MEHTFGEGSYFTIGQNVKVSNHYANNACGVNIFVYNNDRFDHLEPLIIPPYIKYITIELDHKIPFEILIQHLKDIEFEEGHTFTYFKVKTANIFVKNERDIYELIYSKLNQKSCRIDFEYSKFVSSDSDIENKVIKDIIENKKIEISEKGNSDSNSERITANNIDDLILTTEQIGKLFKSVLTDTIDAIDKELDTDLTEDTLTEEIMHVFFDELNNTQEKIPKRYTIKLISVETNGFMALGKNKIDLDIPGITRIVAGNGIGKTTLYNMIRWIITGKVFESQKSNTSSTNNLVVFNKDLPNQTDVVSTLVFECNGLSCCATRTVKRIWKNNTTDEQKSNIDWKEYISKVDKTFKIAILGKQKEDGTYENSKILEGEPAEKAILIWFGNTINNILFLNSENINKILKSSSDTLNELILNFIGVDYLKILEDNLDSLKDNLLSKAKKPSRKKEDIKMAIIDNKIFLGNIDKEIETKNKEIEEKQDIISEKDKKRVKYNEELIKYGNVEELIDDKEDEISTIEKFIEKFEFKDLLDKKTTEGIEKPIQDKETLTKLQEKKEKLINKNKEVLELKKEYKNTIENFDSISGLDIYVKEQEEKSNNRITDLNKSKDVKIARQKRIVELLLIDCNTQISDIKEVIATKVERKTKYLSEITQSQSNIVDYEKSIESGVCKECNRPFGTEEEWEVKVEELKLKISQEKSSITLIKGKSEKNDEKLTEIKELLEHHEEIRDGLISEKSVVATNYELRDLPIEYKSLTSEIDELNEDIKWDETFQKNLKLLFNIKHDEGQKSLEAFPLENTKNVGEIRKYIEDWIKLYDENRNGLNDCDKSIEQRRDRIDTISEAIKTLETTYNKELAEYTELIENIVKENETIDLQNKSIIEHNKQFSEQKVLLVSKKEELIKLQEQLVPFLELKKNYKDIEEEIKTLNSDIKEYEKSNNDNKVKKESYNNIKVTLSNELDNFIEYTKNQLIWKIYSKLIKSSFKEIIFDYYRSYLNNTLNDLLIDVNFKLFWNKNSDLFMTSYKDGRITYQSVIQSSQMETVFLGLSLVYTVCLLNIKNNINAIFIDELSGALNDGKDLGYDAENYRDLFVKILNKFTDKSIFIIDHVIKNMFETVKYVVKPDKEGSLFEKIV
jgi:DNA repair exonuclease SbcCD ATPase subunit